MAVDAVFGLPFREQLAHFRNKLRLPSERWDDISQSAHDRIFIAAGVAKADLLQDLHNAIARQMDGGLGLEGFRRDFRALVARHGWTGWTGEGSPAGEAWRTRVIYRTNLRTSWAAGRWRQLSEGRFRYWMWRHSGLAEEPRPEHLEWDGMVLPADDPFWRLHYPPQIPPNWGCGCRVVGVDSPEAARALGGDPGKGRPENWQQIDVAQKDPALLAEGWNFAPGANAMRPLLELVDRRLLRLDAAIGAAMWEALAPALAAERATAYGAWLTAIADEPRARSVQPVVGALDARDLAWLREAGRPLPATAEISISSGVILGPKAIRHARRGDALPPQTWENLPALLAEPLAVLYDRNRGTMLYVLADRSARRPLLALEFEYLRRGRPGAPNQIVSGYRPPLQDLLARVRDGSLTLMRGALEQE